MVEPIDDDVTVTNDSKRGIHTTYGHVKKLIMKYFITLEKNNYVCQMQQDWITGLKQSVKGKGAVNKNVKAINLRGKDRFCQAVGFTMPQMSKLDKHAQVSVKEGIKSHGHKAIEVMMKDFI